MPHITPAHWHVLLNHIPIIGLPIIAALLLWGLVRREDAVIRVALIGAILVAAGTWVVDLTGDPANHDVRGAAWYQKSVEHEHEEAGDRTNIIAIVSGVLAAATLFLARRGRPFGRKLAFLVLAVLVVAAMAAAWTAWEGGKIRHTEFDQVSPPGSVGVGVDPD